MAKPHQLPSGRWRIQWFDVDGKRQSDTFATFDQARSELRRYEVQVEEERIRRERLGTGALTVTEAGERFLTSLRRGPDDTERRFKHRKDAHQTAFDKHIKPHIGDEKLVDLTPARLRRWLETLAATKTNRPGEKNEEGRTLSSSRVRGVLCTMRQIAEAHDVPIVVKLPKQLRQKRKKTAPHALQTIEHVRKLLEACRDPWFKVAAAIACYCGARLGEVASLRWRHVNEQSGIVTIAMSWEGPLKHRAESGEDDEGLARIVPLDPELAAILKAWREVTDGKDDDRVVLVGGKRPLREGYDDVAQKTRSACKRAEVPEVTFHELRHSYATIASSNGLPLALLQALLGHANIATTGIYVNPDSARAALDPRARLSAPVSHTTENPTPALTN